VRWYLERDEAADTEEGTKTDQDLRLAWQQDPLQNNVTTKHTSLPNTTHLFIVNLRGMDASLRQVWWLSSFAIDAPIHDTNWVTQFSILRASLPPQFRPKFHQACTLKENQKKKPQRWKNVLDKSIE